MEIINGIAILDNFLSDMESKDHIDYFENSKNLHHQGLLTFKGVNNKSVNENDKKCTEMAYKMSSDENIEINLLVNDYIKNYTGHLNYNPVGLWKYGSQWIGGKYKKYLKNTDHYNLIHQERDGHPELTYRLFSVLIYLSDVEIGGKTVFPLHDVSVKPESGKVVIWPSGFPYLHYGEMPESDDKYVINTWLNLTVNEN